MKPSFSIRAFVVFVTVFLVVVPNAFPAIRGSVDRDCPAGSFFYKNEEPIGGENAKFDFSVTVPKGKVCNVEVTWTDAGGIAHRYNFRPGDSAGAGTSLPPQGVMNWACKGDEKDCKFSWEVDSK